MGQDEETAEGGAIDSLGLRSDMLGIVRGVSTLQPRVSCILED